MPIPIDSKESASCLTRLVAHEDYLSYCCNNEQIQKHWTAPEYVVYPINEAMGQPVPVLTSHINPGDFFTMGKSKKVGLVTGKITNIQVASLQNRKPSVHPNGDYLSYDISGDIGGFFYSQPHAKLSSGFFLWLPLPMQLLAIGMTEEYQQLSAIAFNVASCVLNNSTTQKDDYHGRVI